MGLGSAKAPATCCDFFYFYKFLFSLQVAAEGLFLLGLLQPTVRCTPCGFKTLAPPTGGVYL
jgi:hypothetical protein